MIRKTKVIITDDSPSFIQGLVLMIGSNSLFEIIATCSNGLELLQSKDLLRADLLLIDIEMPVMNGFEAAKKISFIEPKLPMIAITMNRTTVFLRDVVMAGFKGFVYKTEIHKDLFDTIEKVLTNKFVFPKELNL
ncbi:MAG: response regulator transcription factor [Marinilabiliaceae bacterium]|nr:response regulator transcription factor [Marinilabiliaceae bacterium]